MKLYHNPNIKEWTTKIIEKIFSMEGISIEKISNFLVSNDSIIEYIISQNKPQSFFVLPVQLQQWYFVIVYTTEDKKTRYSYYTTNIDDLHNHHSLARVYPILMSQEDMDAYLPRIIY